MEYINDIHINEAIIHVLDNNAGEPLLNSFILDLNEEIYKFLLKHMEKLLKDEELKYAIFNSGRNIVKESAQEYLNGENDIVTISHDIANQLFTLMKSNGNVPSCDLIVVSISTEYSPMLAILKMDYIKNYVHKIDFKENNIDINIVSQTSGLPSSGQKIQKCAFIKPIRQDEEFHLMVLDKQSKSKEKEQYGSNYFISNYLGCSLVDNERDMTKNLLNATETWTRNNVSEDAGRAETIRTTVKKKLREEETINVEDLSTELFKEEPLAKESFIQFVEAQGLEDTVTIDKQWVDKKLKRTRLKIDKDIDLYLSEEAYHDKDRFEIKKNGDGSINIVIKHVINYIEK